LWLSGGPFTTQPRVMAVMMAARQPCSGWLWLALPWLRLRLLAAGGWRGGCCRCHVSHVGGDVYCQSCRCCHVMSVSIIGPQSVMSSCRCLSVCQSASQQKSADRATPFGCRSHFSLKGAEGSPGRPPCLPGDPRHCSLRTLQESLAPCPRPRCTLRGTAAQPGRPGAGTMLLR
jgi:hypothetical protein